MLNAHPAPTLAARPVTLEYLGFHNTVDRREYVLRARSGADAREYIVWIAYTAFAARLALLQDGPDICFQKLRRELAEADLTGVVYVGVTESDLASYRAAHAPPARRSLSPDFGSPPPKRAPASAGAWMSPSSPPLPDGRG